VAQPTIAKREKRWLFAYSMFLVVLTSFPYILAFINQGADWVFTGFLFGVEDGNSYIAKMLNGAQGAWLFRSPYSAVEQQGALLYLPYLLLGKLLGSKASHIALVGLYHLFRVIAIGALSFAVHNFISLHIQESSLRKIGLIVATLGGGLGWVILAFGQTAWLGSLPLDFYSPESFGFLAIFGLPHLTLARALLFWGLTNYLNNRSDVKSMRFRIALLWLAMGLVHLLAVVVGLVLLGTHLAFTALRNRQGDYSEKEQARWTQHFNQAIWAVSGAALPLLYNAWLYLKDPYLQAWAAQNLIPSPHPFHYLLAYGLLLPFVYFGARHLLSKDYCLGSFPVLWLLLLPLMVYSPFGVQRRFAEGVWIAFLVLALAAFESKPLRYRQSWRWLFAALGPTTAILLLGSLRLAQNPELPAFRPIEEISAFGEFRAQSQNGVLILTSFQTGNALPAWSPSSVLIGHGPESVGLPDLSSRVYSFYGTVSSDEERINLIQEFGVDYVFLGPAERELGKWRAEDMHELDLIIKNGSYSIYRVLE
jgi:hypothetical protein